MMEQSDGPQKFGPFAVQILRGSIRNETQQFYLTDAETPINLVFEHTTSIYQL